MSWSTSTPEPVARDLIADIPVPHLSDVVEAEQTEQFAAAMSAVAMLLDAVGRPADDVYVSLSGHANPAHGPRDGWADECIRITIEARPTA